MLHIGLARERAGAGHLLTMATSIRMGRGENNWQEDTSTKQGQLATEEKWLYKRLMWLLSTK